MGEFARAGVPAAEVEQRRWRETRRYLNQHRPDLTRAAVALYPGAARVANTLLLSIRPWLPTTPQRLEDVRLRWKPEAAPAFLTGREQASGAVRPHLASGGQFASYADAIASLDRPRLFEDRPSYRLLDVNVATDPCMAFGPGSYFDVMNISEAIAHEFASRVRDGSNPTLDQLPFRSLIGDPFDLQRRPLMVAISALTLRWDSRSGSASYVLHWRDPQRVATGGGLYQVMPVGMFQPISGSPQDLRNDFDLWRSLVREYSEEFLGAPERDHYDGSYDDWPFFQAMDQARRNRAVRAYCLGIGIDPLTLVADILMAVVFEAEAYDDLLGAFVVANEEGQVITAEGQGFPFIEAAVDTTERPMQPAGAAALALSWQHRAVLLKPS